MLIASGLLLVVFALLVGNSTIEQALLGEATGTLQWGPLLFRVLLAVHGASLIAYATYRKRTRNADASIGDSFSPKVPEDNPTPFAVWMGLAGLTVVGAALGIWKLGSCLWYDEIATVVDILQQPLPVVVTSFPSQNQHMFFSVLARISMSIFGDGAAAVRLPSVMFGLLSIWALFLLGKRVIGIGMSLLACCLMTFSYHHVWFSQNARGYMGLLFFTILATWLLIEARRRGGSGWWIAFAIALALGTWTHMTMVFVAFAQAIIFVAAELGGRSREDNAGSKSLMVRMRPLLAWILSATLTLQLYALGLPEFLANALHEVSNPSEWTNPLWVVKETIRNLAGNGLLAVVVVSGGAFVAFLGWWRILKQQPSVAWMMVLPGFLAGGTMLALGHNLWPRFFFFCMGFAILLAISGAVQCTSLLPRRILLERGQSRLATICVLIVIVGSASTLPRNYAFPKQDFTGARDFIENQKTADEGVVGVGLAGVAYEILYAPAWSVAQTGDELEEVLENQPRMWLVYTIPIEVRNYHPGLWEVIEDRFETVKVFPGTLGAGEVTVCRTKS